jgi:hypothetical protein
MPQSRDVPAHQEAFRRLKEATAEALRHTRLAQQLAAERRDLIRGLIAEGFSRAGIAREPGVTRQAIQKMLACRQGGARLPAGTARCLAGPGERRAAR